MSDLTKEEVQAIVEESIKKTLGGLNAELDRRFETFGERVSETIEASSANFLDELIEEAEDLDLDDEDFEDDDEYDDYEDDEDEPVNRPDPELLRMKRELEAIKAQAEADREAREQAERDRQVAMMRSTALEAIRKSGKVVNPDAFLKLLEADGKLAEKDGAFVIKSRDQYGDKFDTIDSTLDTFLSGDYSYLASPRGGTGTGATQGTSRSGFGSGLKYFDGDGKPKVDPGEAIGRDREGYLKELAQVQSQK